MKYIVAIILFASIIINAYKIPYKIYYLNNNLNNNKKYVNIYNFPKMKINKIHNISMIIE